MQQTMPTGVLHGRQRTAFPYRQHEVEARLCPHQFSATIVRMSSGRERFAICHATCFYDDRLSNMQKFSVLLHRLKCCPEIALINKELAKLAPTILSVFPFSWEPCHIVEGSVASCYRDHQTQRKCAIHQSDAWKIDKYLAMPKRTYSEMFSFVHSSPTH